MSTEKQTIAEQFPWATVGADVVIFEEGSWGYTNVTPAKIAKVSATRVTLEGGRVFYVPKYSQDLKELGRETYRSPDLLPLDDPRIAEVKETQRKEQIRLNARDAAKQYARDSHSEEKARAAIKALEAFLEAWVEVPE